VRVKELNFVFLHGAGGTSCSLQLLADTIMEQVPAHISYYEQAHPGIKIQADSLLRCYPNDVDIKSWANNIAESINKHFPDKENLILIGHSMGGKVALYAVAHNISNLASKVAMVVTINSPIKSLDQYYITGGGSILDYCRARWLLATQGVCDSVAFYDSSQDGLRVASTKHWLAFISGEGAPLSEQFNVGGVDPMPRDIDDSTIPLSAQYSDGADAVYYGEHGHSDFGNLDEVAGFMADQILRYLFGGNIECSVFSRSGTFEHRADWLLGTDYWEDTVGEILASSGRLWHVNQSPTSWQEWQDRLGESLFDDKRSSYQIRLVRGFPFFTGIKEVRWFSPDNLKDSRLYLKTKAAPGDYLEVDWSIYRQGLLPEGSKRDHYEVKILTGTPLTKIERVSWAGDDPRDTRLKIRSEAESPFRWFKAEWKVYAKESRERKVISEIPGRVL